MSLYPDGRQSRVQPHTHTTTALMQHFLVQPGTVNDLQLLDPVQVVQRRHQGVVLARLFAALPFVLVGEDRVRLIQQEGQPAGRQALLSTRTQRVT